MVSSQMPIISPLFGLRIGMDGMLLINASTLKYIFEFSENMFEIISSLIIHIGWSVIWSIYLHKNHYCIALIHLNQQWWLAWGPWFLCKLIDVFFFPFTSEAFVGMKSLSKFTSASSGAMSNWLSQLKLNVLPIPRSTHFL